MITLNDDDFNKLVIYGERYCLGRMTYAVSDYIDIVDPRVTTLQTSTLQCLCRDFADTELAKKRFEAYSEAERLEEAKVGLTFGSFQNPWGMEQDEKAWKRFWKRCKAEFVKRERR